MKFSRSFENVCTPFLCLIANQANVSKYDLRKKKDSEKNLFSFSHSFSFVGNAE
jgi:hypothetical protein